MKWQNLTKRHLEYLALGVLGTSLAVWTWMGWRELASLSEAAGYLVMVPQLILPVLSLVIVYVLSTLLFNQDHRHRRSW
jgi:hypothetical protein